MGSVCQQLFLPIDPPAQNIYVQPGCLKSETDHALHHQEPSVSLPVSPSVSELSEADRGLNQVAVSLAANPYSKVVCLLVRAELSHSISDQGGWHGQHHLCLQK